MEWRIAVATVIGFSGSAFGTVGGVGGGRIFVDKLWCHSVQEIICFNLNWKKTTVLVIVWCCFVLLQVLKVASATATFVMVFSSSLSVVEFYFLKRFLITFALYLMSISLLAGFWGQYFVRKLVAFLQRASIIVFILSAVIFASALTLGVIGIEKSLQMINNHEFMGFLNFCENHWLRSGLWCAKF